MTNAKAQATRLLSYYMECVWVNVGLQWNEDNHTEMRVLVDLLITAACDEMERQGGAS